MAGTIKDLLDKVQSMNINAIITESLVETRVDFEAENKIQMLMGLTWTGELIKPSYRSGKYARVKKEQGSLAPQGTPDLFVTGEFQRLIDVEVSLDTLDIISKDEKGPELEAKYKNIFGLGGEYKEGYLKVLQPVIRNKIKKAIGL